MNWPTLSCDRLPDGHSLQVERDIDRARNKAEQMGLMDRVTEELRDPGIGVKFAVGIGRDEGWLRAIVACAPGPDFGTARDVGWMAFSLSPIRQDSRQTLIDLVAGTIRRDPKTLKIVYR